jgi:hypothetical protein
MIAGIQAIRLVRIRECEKGYFRNLIYFCKGEFGLISTFSIPVYTVTPQSRSGKQTPTKLIHNGVMGEIFFKASATTKCPINII